MNILYAALPYLLIFAQTLCPFMFARRYASSRLIKSKWVLALLAALPIPALLVVFAVFSFNDVLTGYQAYCEVDGCAVERAAFTTLMVSAFALYLFGCFNALLGYRAGKTSFAGRRSE